MVADLGSGLSGSGLWNSSWFSGDENAAWGIIGDLLTTAKPRRLELVDKEFRYRPTQDDSLGFDVDHLVGAPVVVNATTFKSWTPPDDCEVAVVSWPVNNRQTVLDLLRLLPYFKTLVYVGKNTDGTACGTPELFNWLLQYRPTTWFETSFDTLIIYDLQRQLPEPRIPCCEEELAALAAEMVRYGSRQEPQIREEFTPEYRWRMVRV